MTQSQLPSALLRVARAYAGQITKKAKAYAPNHLRPYISSHAEELEPGRIVIRTIANRGANPTNKEHPNYGSSDARAQEYGSGLRARRGAKHTYKIIGQPWLAFYVGGGGGNAFGAFDPTTRKGVGARDIVVTHEVNHPGIQAANKGKGYIAPAINEVRKSMRESILKNGNEAIHIDIRRSFGLR